MNKTESTAPRPFRADRKNEEGEITKGSAAPRRFPADHKDEEAVVVIDKTRGTIAQGDKPLGDDHDNDGGNEYPNALTDSESESQDPPGGRAKKRRNDTIRQRQRDDAQRPRKICQAKIDLETQMKKARTSLHNKLKSLQDSGETCSPRRCCCGPFERRRRGR